jgi:hypothetical protein
MNKIDNYLQSLYIQEEFETLQEGLGDAMKKFTADKMKSFSIKLKGAIQSKNIKQAQKLASSSGLAKIKPAAVDSYMNSKSADYSVAKGLASKVLKNSLPGKPSKKAIDRGATFIAVKSLMSEKKGVPPNVTANAKKHIKQFVTMANKYYDDYEQQSEESEKGGKAPPIPADSLPDYVVGAVIVVGFTVIAGATTWWLYHNLAFFLILIITVVGVLAAMGALAGLVIAKKGA